MANDKNKINELVSDDEDPTAELEVLSFRETEDPVDTRPRESDADTFGFSDDDGEPDHENRSLSALRSDLRTRSRTISRLQHDIEQLRAKWTGLETEIKAREQIVGDLNLKIDELGEAVARKEKLLRKRDATIRSLKAEIRQRDEAHRELMQQHSAAEQQAQESRSAAEGGKAALQSAKTEIADLHEQIRQLREQSSATRDAGSETLSREIGKQLQRTEQYADELRVKLKDLAESHDDITRDRDRLAQNLAGKLRENHELAEELDDVRRTVLSMEQRIEALQKDHEEELRIVRFELGEAQNTVAETSDLNTQLASDLVDTRSYKEELERMLTDTEERAQSRIGELEKDIGNLQRSASEYEEKLESKSAAINVLLNELTKKSEQIEAIGEIEDVIQDIDDRMSERIDDVPGSEDAQAEPQERERDKVTRLLVGSIGEQVLRFPLFKDRLTIGRTADNDIQLKLSYISRRHAVVLTEGDATRVIDWGSKNGVYVNSNRVKEHFLSNGDILAVGNAKFRYEERRKRD